MSSFGIVPRLQEILVDERLSESDRKVYLALCSFCHAKDYTCYPKRERLAKVAGIKAVVTVSRSITKLKESGYLKVHRRQSSENNRYYNIYEIICNFTTVIEAEKEDQSDDTTRVTERSPKQNAPENGVSNRVTERSPNVNLGDSQITLHKDKLTKKKTPKGVQKEAPPPTAKKFVEGKKMLEIWNEVTESSQRYSDERRKMLRVFFFNKDYCNGSLDWWREYCETIAKSDFLMGRKLGRDGRRYKASLNFALRPSSADKVLDGEYEDDRHGANDPQNDSTPDTRTEQQKRIDTMRNIAWERDKLGEESVSHKINQLKAFEKLYGKIDPDKPPEQLYREFESKMAQQ